jgi:glutathione S-transferase
MSRVLYLTPQSHFSRKVRIVMDELGLDCEHVYVPNLLSTDPAKFGGNPILRVPVMQDGPVWLVESDSIVRHLLGTYDAGRDRFGFFAMDAAQRNALSIVAAVMGAEVELLLSKRSGIGPEAGGHYFRRYREVIRHGLDWIEAQAAAAWPSTDFSYLDVALICMWDHLEYNRLLALEGACPWIRARTGMFASRPSVAATTPKQMEKLQWELYPGQRPAGGA